MPMKKKARPEAKAAAKRRKTAVPQRKAEPQRAPRPSSIRPLQSSAEAKLTIRRLKAQLAHAHARIGELEASANIDFLLDIHNRRGFERELNRSVAFIERY